VNHSPRTWLTGVVASSLIGGLIAVSAGVAAHASTEVVDAPLPAPTSLTPDDSGLPFPHPVRKNVKLDWAPVSGATGYRVQIGTDETWSDDPALSKDVVYSELTLPLWISKATYVWRVAALKGTAVGHWSSQSDQAQPDAEFTFGWRTAPSLNTVTSPFFLEPTFSWDPIATASGYQLQVSEKPFGSTPTSTQSPDTSPSPGTQTQASSLVLNCYTPRTRVTMYSDAAGKSDTVGDCKQATIPDAGTTVYWRVRALDAYVGEGETPSTTPLSEAGISELPPSDDPDKQDPNLILDCPKPGPTPTPTDTASPTPSPSASPGSVGGCTPSRPSVAGAWSSDSFVWDYTIPAGVAGPLVTTHSLASDPDDLCDVTNAGAPEAEHALCRDVPTISWDRVVGATSYRVNVALDDAFSNIVAISETSALEWTTTGSWRDSPPGTTYYYGVQACTDASCGPVTPTPPSFSKSTPRLVLGTSPSVTGEPHFTWQSYAAALTAATGSPATQDAFSYRLQVARDDHPSFDQTVLDTLVDETYLTPLKNLGDGAFVWRVQPIDSRGNKLPFSLSKKFTRDATAPRVVSVSPSSGVAVNSTLTVTFSEPVTGVSATSLGLSPAVAHTVSVVNAMTYRITPTAVMVPGATYRVVLTSAIHDSAGNAAQALGPTFTVSKSIADNSKAFAYSGSWSVRSASNAFGGSYHAAVPTSTSHPYATTKFYGAAFNLYSCLGPSNGYLDIYVDNVKKARVSLYRSYSGCAIKVAAITGLTRTTHTLKLVGVGAHASASKGNGVAVDHVSVG